MPNWLTEPLVKADKIDQPRRQRWQPVATSGGRGSGFDPDQSKAFLGGALEGNSSPLDAALTFFPYGRVGKALKGLYGAGKGVQKASTPAVGVLEEMIQATQTGPVGPKLPGIGAQAPSLPSSLRGLGLELERRVIEGQTMPRRKLLPPAMEGA